jgi:ribosomal-protein-alanine N-acetyltransferase
MTDPLSLIAAGPAHAGVLAALHAAAFADPAISGPAWDAASFASLLALPGVEGWILMDADTPRALSLWRTVLDETELLTIATDPAAQGRGLGRTLLQAGLDHLAGLGVVNAFLEVAVTNTAAIRLYASTGFTVTGRRKGYYQHAGVSTDANIMMLDLLAAKLG